MKEWSTQLTIPNDITFLNLIQSYIAEVAEKTGFSKNTVSKIQLAVEEAVTNVIEHAFEQAQSEKITIVCERIPSAVRIVIKEKGLPFDPALLPEFDKAKLENELSGKGLGLLLMKQFMDEVSFHNMGKEGKETHLLKYVEDKRIEAYLEKEELEKIDEEKKKQQPDVTAKIPFSVRLMAPSEAVEVSKCAFMAYGYSYSNEDIYFPERIRQYNKSGKIISIIAVTNAQEEIMGHAALIIDDYDLGIADAAMGFVKPKFRGQGCLNRLLDFLVEEASRRNLTGIYGEATTNHLFSQKASHKILLEPTALLISRFPPSEYKNIQTDSTQRKSSLYCFRYIHKPASTSIYAPLRHKKIIDKIYSNLGLKPSFLNPENNEADAKDNPVIRVSTDNYLAAKIDIESYGRGCIEEVQRMLKNLCAERFETIYLYLNLALRETGFLCERLEESGFFFGGIIPGSSGKDRLILQYLNNQIIDYNAIEIASELGRELKEYIRGKDPYQD